MSSKRYAQNLAITSLMTLILSGCYHPPYNNYRPYNRTFKDLAVGAGVGAAVGAVVGSPVTGTGIGAATFAIRGLYKESRVNIIKDLQKADIQVERYGDTMTMIVPTDRYFVFNTPRLKELCWPGLVLIVKLLRFYPNSVIYVAGFTDNVGSRYHKKMISQSQAETMLTFLWANGIQAQRLAAEGYGDKNPIGDNAIIHGSAHNRRIEIQWFDRPVVPLRAAPMPYLGPTK